MLIDKRFHETKYLIIFFSFFLSKTYLYSNIKKLIEKKIHFLTRLKTVAVYIFYFQLFQIFCPTFDQR